MLHKDYCSRCKIKGVSLCKYSKNKTTQYYMCRQCNNTRRIVYMRTEKGKKAYHNLSLRNWNKYPEKRIARYKINYAVKKGIVKKSPLCEVCSKEGRIEGHHMDYTKPLEVIWLCVGCHNSYH